MLLPSVQCQQIGSSFSLHPQEGLPLQPVKLFSIRIRASKTYNDSYPKEINAVTNQESNSWQMLSPQNICPALEHDQICPAKYQN